MITPSKGAVTRKYLSVSSIGAQSGLGGEDAFLERVDSGLVRFDGFLGQHDIVARDDARRFRCFGEAVVGALRGRLLGFGFAQLGLDGCDASFGFGAAGIHLGRDQDARARRRLSLASHDRL